MDKLTREQRSKLMSRIRSKWTGWEKAFYEDNPSAIPHPHWLPFSPDFLLQNRPIFLDSSFWHGFIKKQQFDKLNDQWQQKIIRNICRDLGRDAFYNDLAVII